MVATCIPTPAPRQPVPNLAAAQEIYEALIARLCSVSAPLATPAKIGVAA